MRKLLRPLKVRVKFYLELVGFLGELGRAIVRSHPDPWMQNRFLFELSRFTRSLRDGESMIKTTDDSKAAYEAYDDRDIRDYYSQSSTMLLNNEVKELTFKEERRIHLDYIYSEIDKLLAKKGRIRLIEIGCGNCINLFEILQKYGDKVDVWGVDISPQRIAVAQKYFGDGLAKAHLQPMSITERTPFADGQFDLVYSMHCLEQIAYDARAAVAEMYRIAGSEVFMIEPVYENGNFLQKLYLINSDHIRVLLKSIKELKLPLIRNEVNVLQSNPSHQSSILTIEKR